MKQKLITSCSTQNYVLSSWSRTCYITDVNKTFDAVDICNLQYILI